MKICYKCGEVDPDYDVVGYARICNECKEVGVMTIQEMAELINDLEGKGVINGAMMDNYVDEEYSKPALNFEVDDILQAQEDALHDMMKEGWL